MINWTPKAEIPMPTEISEATLSVDLHNILDRVAHGEEITVKRVTAPPVKICPSADTTGTVPHDQLAQEILDLRKKNGPLEQSIWELRHEGHRY